MRFLFFVVLLFLVFGCNSRGSRRVDFLGAGSSWAGLSRYNDHSWLLPFERSPVEQLLKQKVKDGKPLVVHCLVPLCDNEHQGIVPTTPSLGDGFSTQSNLYWATRNGVKRYFATHAAWKSLEVIYTPSDTILERVAFQRAFENGARVILVCDAYRGDQMYACVTDYFAFLAGKKSDVLLTEKDTVHIGDEADLVAFNGHNGLMDVQPDWAYASRKRMKDAVVIACSSHGNFTEPVTYANCYPLVTTTGLLYPGASVLNAIIESWALFKSEEEIRKSAGEAYNALKDCGAGPADQLFYTGW